MHGVPGIKPVIGPVIRYIGAFGLLFSRLGGFIKGFAGLMGFLLSPLKLVGSLLLWIVTMPFVKLIGAVKLLGSVTLATFGWWALALALALSAWTVAGARSCCLALTQISRCPRGWRRGLPSWTGHWAAALSRRRRR